MLRTVIELLLEGGETVDAVQHILAIAERERRKRAQKEAPDQAPSRPAALNAGQDLPQKREDKSWTR
jgi:hypothetical protein